MQEKKGRNCKEKSQVQYVMKQKRMYFLIFKIERFLDAEKAAGRRKPLEALNEEMEEI